VTGLLVGYALKVLAIPKTSQRPIQFAAKHGAMYFGGKNIVVFDDSDYIQRVVAGFQSIDSSVSQDQSVSVGWQGVDYSGEDNIPRRVTCAIWLDCFDNILNGSGTETIRHRHSAGDVQGRGFPGISDNHARESWLVSLNDHFTNSYWSNPSTLVNVHARDRNAGEHYIYSGGKSDKYGDKNFAQSRAWARFSGWLLCIGSCIGHFGWVWLLAHGIHDRRPRKLVFAILIFPLSVFATAHGAGLLLGI